LACLLVFIGGTYYYDCRIKQVCGNPGVQHIALPPLHFGWNDPKPGVEKAFAGVKSALLAKGDAGEALTITGLYYESEQAGQPKGVDLGTLRAQAVAQLFASDLAPERIQTNSRMLAGAPPGGDSENANSSRFAATDFNWTALIATNVMPAVTPPIAFAPDSAQAIVGPGFEALQTSLNTGGQTQLLEITGLWFEGETESLGLARAKAAAKLFSAWLPDNKASFLVRFGDANATGAGDSSLREALLFRWIDTVPADTSPAAPVGAPLAPTIDAPAQMASIEVFFDSNGVTVLEDANWRSALPNFVTQARGKKVVVRGHTDSSGRASKNDALGLRRANALRDALIAAGLAGADIAVESLSANQPKSDNNSVNGKAQNRRAEAKIVE
jgi:outer membrane protein OmpA-like peptidoglycan-associated protein